MLRSLRQNLRAVIDLGIVLLIGIAFAGLMVISYIIYTLSDMLGQNANAKANATIGNITSGFDDAISLILIAITIFILAIAISALLMLRGR